jgi:hypothetical protein
VLQVHQRSHRKAVKQEAGEAAEAEAPEEAVPAEGTDWHLLQEPVYLGEERGLAAARRYHSMDPAAGLHRCSVCQFTAKGQQASMHVLARHLPMVHLFRCPVCGRDFRYSRIRFREHVAQHAEGKLQCERCPDSSQEYTRESLKAHTKRVHSLGRFPCGVRGQQACHLVFATKAEVRDLCTLHTIQYTGARTRARGAPGWAAGKVRVACV